MKKILVFCSVLLIALLSASPAVSQKLTVGILNGINFTKPQGEFTTGKWAVKNGPVTGLFVNYRLTKTVSLQTEFDYTVVNYSHKPYSYSGYIDLSTHSSSSYYPYYYYNQDEKWEFSFYRIPLYLKLSTPTKLKLEMAIGGYFSFRDNYEVPDYPTNIYDDMMPYNISQIPPRYDAGFFYSVGLSYPMAEHFNIYLNGRYFSGKRTYIESVAATNGVAEMTFGLGYCGFFKNKNNVVKPDSVKTSISHLLTVTIKNGIAVTGNSGSDHNKMYSNATGLSSGLSFLYHLSKNFALQGEVLYDRKGYDLKGASNSFFKYTPGSYYAINNRVSMDYITIPLLFNLSFGEKFTVYLNAGIYTAMRMNARVTGTAYTTTQNETTYRIDKINVYDDIDGFMKNTDWGWVFGSGIQYPLLKKYRLDIEFRYNTGNTNMYSTDANYTPAENEDMVIKNKTYTFSLGFQIPLN